MDATFRVARRLCLVFAVLVVGVLLTSTAASATTCTGTWFDYFDSPMFQEIVGSKVVCPGFPDQIDTDANGNYTETAWFTAQTVVCPCPGSGGGNNGGGDPHESDGDELPPE